MKKQNIIKTLALSILCVPFNFIFAQGPAVNPTVIKIQSPIKSTSVSQVLVAFFNILVQIGAVVVTLAIVYAGFLFVVARGNPEQLNKAKTTLFWTIIGAMVLLGAQVIAGVIQATIKTL